MTEHIITAQQYFDDAQERFKEENYLHSLELARKAMDAFPPLGKFEMDDALSLLVSSVKKINDNSSLWEGRAHEKAYRAALLKASVRKMSHKIFGEHGLTILATSVEIHRTISQLEAFYERDPHQHPELYVNLAGTKMRVPPNVVDLREEAKEHLDTALSLGGDAKKIYYMMMSLWVGHRRPQATDAEYEEARLEARECAKKFIEAARGDERATQHAGNFIMAIYHMEPRGNGNSSAPAPSQGQ